MELPEFFTNPFDYRPHPYCVQAAEQLQEKLGEPESESKGKMYGVLIVKNKSGELGFLSAYSGNEQSQFSDIPFVPQVFEITNPKGFFRKGEAELNQMNETIHKAEHSEEHKQLLEDLNAEKEQAEILVNQAKLALKQAKKERKAKRKQAEQEAEHEHILEQLIRESQREKSQFNQIKRACKQKVEAAKAKLDAYQKEVNELKQARKKRSAQLQQQIFDSYLFLNAEGSVKSASDIFRETDAKVPPAGAGDCCAPKLMQYAYQNELEPIAMAEFWWGKSPKKEIRKHAYFYPACKSKCEPILGHMLKGLKLEKTAKKVKKLQIEVLYEDDAIAIIHKPSGLLSVPGKEEKESVYSQAKTIYPQAEEPLIVHRLDMATSGIMLIAKTKTAHEILQKQFLDKSIQKRYVAILDGVVPQEEGSIKLPLRVDLEDRPRQLVCFEYGKEAFTKWKVVERSKRHSKVHFYPITGRTHQLRVHAAHADGLNTPIVGDELYGQKAERLLLHAEEIRFVHPTTNKAMTFICPAKFDLEKD
jgi:tRNA pseudouridine32 synthase/23S rRNA pseudouridine746 synthase